MHAAAQSFRANADFDTETAITELATGEALVSALDARGQPTPVQRTLIRPPSSLIGPASTERRQELLESSPWLDRYRDTIDRDSAHEMLGKRVRRPTGYSARAARNRLKKRSRAWSGTSDAAANPRRAPRRAGKAWSRRWPKAWCDRWARSSGGRSCVGCWAHCSAVDAESLSRRTQMLKRIFEPLSINKLQIANRIARTAHGEHLGPHYVSDQFIAYHLERAKHGVGLSIFGIAEIDPSSGGVGGVWSDEVIPRYQKLMRALAPHEMKVIQQLWHGGHHYPSLSGGPPPAPSTVPSPFARALNPGVGVPMDRAEIQRLVAQFAAGARRCQEGGVHGVELHGAHGYLIYQFLSPVTNTRSDEYGGSIENRMRFLVEIYQAVRKGSGAGLRGRLSSQCSPSAKWV